MKKKLKKSLKKVEKKLKKSWKKVEKSWKKVGRYVFFGQVMSSHHSDQMSQRSQVSRTALWGCSLNVFVIVFLFVFVFVIFLVMSCLFITLNKCLKGHKSLGLLLGGVFKMSLSLSLSLHLSLSICLVMSSLFITLNKCLKGRKSLGSLCNAKSKSDSVSQSVSDKVTYWAVLDS